MDFVIGTFSCKKYWARLRNMIGSVQANWLDHPPIIVYDIGLTKDQAEHVTKFAGVKACIKVPPFVPHWRKHYTWKTWIWNNLLNHADAFFALDAGLSVLKPMPEVLYQLEAIGYFVASHKHSMTEEVTLAHCKGCNLPPEFRNGKPMLNAGMVGFSQRYRAIVEEILEVASVEENIAPDGSVIHPRWEQAILTTIMHKRIGDRLIYGDQDFYMRWEDGAVVGQKIWQHRKAKNALIHEPIIKTDL